MRKNFLLPAIIVLFAGYMAPIGAQENEALTGWDSYFNPGNVSLSAGLGMGGFLYGLGLNLYPGVEVIYAQPNFGGVVPFSFGIAARGIFGLYPGLYSGLNIGTSALATAHLGLKGLDLNSKFLNSLDFYLGFGVSVFFLTPYWTYTSPVQFAAFQGIHYFINNKFSIYLESSYLGLYYYYLTAGVLFRLGK